MHKRINAYLHQIQLIAQPRRGQLNDHVFQKTEFRHGFTPVVKFPHFRVFLFNELKGAVYQRNRIFYFVENMKVILVA